MSKYLSVLWLFMLCTLACFAADPSAQLVEFSQTNYTHFGLYNMMQGVPIKYGYEVIAVQGAQPVTNKNEIKANISAQAAEENYINVIENGLKTWPTKVSEAIKQAGRAEEFADVLAVFARFKTERVQTREEANVWFSFADVKYIRSTFETAQGCARTISTNNPIDIFISDPNLRDISNQPPGCFIHGSAYDSAAYHAIHEAGHYYGMADQYSTVNASVVYSNSDRINRNSIMGASYSPKLTCDDVDGLIKMADRTFYMKNGRYSARDEKGWASFCNDGTIYRYGKVLNRKPYLDCGILYRYDADGNVSSKERMPFISYENCEVKRNASTGLTEEIICPADNIKLTYFYELGSEPCVSVSVFTFDFHKYWQERENEKICKNTAGNGWRTGAYKLFTAKEGCRFTWGEENTSLVNAYVNRKDNSLTIERGYKIKGVQNHTKKYNFDKGNFTCEFVNKNRDGSVNYAYTLVYQKEKDAFVVLDKQINALKDETAAREQAEKDCRKPSSEYTYSGISEGGFIATCDLLFQTDVYLFARN